MLQVLSHLQSFLSKLTYLMQLQDDTQIHIFIDKLKYRMRALLGI